MISNPLFIAGDIAEVIVREFVGKEHEEWAGTLVGLVSYLIIGALLGSFVGAISGAVLYGANRLLSSVISKIFPPFCTFYMQKVHPIVLIAWEQSGA